MNQNRYSPNISDCGVILVPRCFAPMMFVTFLASTQALDFGLKLIFVLTMQALPCPHAAKRLWQPSLSWTRWSSVAMQTPHAVCWEVTAQTVAKQCVYTAPSVFRVWSLCPSPWIWGCRCWFSDTQKKRQQSHLPRPCHCCPEILRFANGKATIAVPIVVQWVLVPGWCSPVRSLRECKNAFHQTIKLYSLMVLWYNGHLYCHTKWIKWYSLIVVGIHHFDPGRHRRLTGGLVRSDSPGAGGQPLETCQGSGGGS